MRMIDDEETLKNGRLVRHLQHDLLDGIKRSDVDAEQLAVRFALVRMPSPD